MEFKEFLESIDLSYLLAGQSKVPQIGPEKLISDNNNIRLYKSPQGSYRFVFYIDDEPVSVLQVVSRDKENALVANVWTEPSHRRKGYAKLLFAQARKKFKKVRHADDLSDLGNLWKLNVDNLVDKK